MAGNCKRYDKFGMIKPIIYVFAICLLLFILIFANVTAFAFNSDYLNEEKWNNNERVVTQNVSNSTPFSTLNGTFKYFADENNACLYLYFSVTESSIVDESDLVKIGLNISDEQEEYQLSVDSCGICDCLGGEENLFSVNQNFVTYPSSKSGVYIAVISFENGLSDNFININLYVNGHNYLIMRDFEFTVLDSSSYNSAVKTAKSEETTKSTSKSTTKRSSATTTKYSASRNSNSASNGTTKYYNEDSNSYENDSESVDEITTGDTQYTYSSSKPAMTTNSIILLSLGIAIAVLAIILIMKGILSKPKKTEKTSEKTIEEADNFDF